jgi:LmbE family N-acetylglucosaminyl deacetylase/SAM-dependent methyltransferase
MAEPGDDAPGFDPHADGTPESEWLAALWTTGRRVGARQLLASVQDVVVVAAHPDDESLAAAGLLAAVGRAGLPATVVVATSGEASHPMSPTHRPEQLAVLREEEVRRAVAAVHPAARVLLLAQPDSGLAEHEAHLLDALTPLVDPHTLVVAPWRGDGHADHEAAGRVAAQVAAYVGARLLEYPVWLWHWGTASALGGVEVLCLDLDPELRRGKADALACHRSQTAPLSPAPGDEALLTSGFLAHFARPFEVFLPSRPPARVPAGASSPGASSPGASSRATDGAFDAMFAGTDDPWGFETSWYEQRKRAVTMSCLPTERLGRVLEVGCSTGVLTADLAARADCVVATDVSAEAVDRARRRLSHLGAVQVLRLRAPQEWPDGEFDAVVLSEIGYFWQPEELDEALSVAVGCLSTHGVLVLCHWRHPVQGWPLDGDAVHACARRLPGTEVVASHVEQDFRVDVLARPGWVPPAALEGLA